MMTNSTKIGNTGLTMSTQSATAKPRRFTAKWTVKTQEEANRTMTRIRGRNPIKEIVKRIKVVLGIPVPTLEDELTIALAKEIADEIDKQILKDLKIMVGNNQEN